MEDEDKISHLELTASIVGSYVENNRLPAAGLPELIATVHESLRKLGQKTPETVALVPAVNPKKSVTPDYIVSLEDGRKLKSLKRYLRSNFNMTPDEYRSKWSLPSDYPMVAPNYAAARSALAKELGLGRKPAAKAEPAPAQKAAPKKAGRPRKAAAAAG